MLQQTRARGRESHCELAAVFSYWGLIGGLLQPIYSGIQASCLTRLSSCAVRALAQTIPVTVPRSAARQFCLRSVLQLAAPADIGLDLECWRIAIVDRTHSRADRPLSIRLRPAGSAEAFFTSYGLAESTLVVTGGSRRRPAVLALTRALEAGRVEFTQIADASIARVLVSRGRPLLDQTSASSTRRRAAAGTQRDRRSLGGRPSVAEG
jgi:hypothetical protein